MAEERGFAHGMTLVAAERAVARFLAQSSAEGRRVVLIVTGKGLRLEGGQVVGCWGEGRRLQGERPVLRGGRARRLVTASRRQAARPTRALSGASLVGGDEWWRGH